MDLDEKMLFSSGGGVVAEIIFDLILQIMQLQLYTKSDPLYTGNPPKQALLRTSEDPGLALFAKIKSILIIMTSFYVALWKITLL